MLKINIIAVGGLKENYLREAQSEYIKRLGKFCKLNIVEISEVKTDNNPSEKQIENALNKEGEEILKAVLNAGGSSYNIACCINGKNFASEAFASHIKQISNKNSTVNFVIGSSYGLSQSVKNKADLLLSFGEFTFPHQLMRIILLEQLYRAMTINNNITYHK